MNNPEADHLVAKGLTALDNGHSHLALVCFERAFEIERSPVVSSSLGFCIAAVRGEHDKGKALCREAMESEPSNALHYLNMGRVLLLTGDRDAAIVMFRDGLQLGRNERIVSELEALGTRKPAVLKSLDRSHPLNKWLGVVLYQLGFR